jgi:hypothetical protein
MLRDVVQMTDLQGVTYQKKIISVITAGEGLKSFFFYFV